MVTTSLSRSRFLALAVLYVGLAVAANEVAARFAVADHVYVWYAPSGVMFSALLLAGWRWAPVAFGARLAGALAVGTGAVPAWRVLASAAVATVVYAAGAEAVRGLFRLHRLRTLLWQVGTVIVAGMAVSELSALGLAGLAGLAPVPQSPGLLPSALDMFVGNASGILTLVPPVLFLSGRLRHRPGSLSLARAVELAGGCAGLVAVSWWGGSASGHRFYVVLLPLLLIALRSGLPGASVAVAVASTVLVARADVGAPKPSDLVALCLFIVGASSVTLVVGARESARRSLAERYAAIMEGASEAFVTVTPDGRVEEWNEAAETLFGWSGSQATGRALSHLIVPPGDRDALGRLVGGGPPSILGSRTEMAAVTRDGRRLTVEICVWGSGSGPELRYHASIHDVSERVASRRAERRFAALIEHSSDMITVTDASGHVTYVSPAFASLLGMDPGEAAGRVMMDLLHPDDAAGVRELRGRLVEHPGVTVSHTCRMRHRDGTYRDVEVVSSNHLADPDVQGIVSNVRDVTERAEMSRRLVHRATHDPLTELPNRELLFERMAAAAAEAESSSTFYALLFVDLDRFKDINDSLGHATGDLILSNVAHRLGAVVRHRDTVARMGGDEFAVLAVDLVDIRSAVDLGERIRESLAQPIELPEQTLTVGASVGIARSSAGLGPDDLLKHADIAMYRAKERGRNRCELYRPAMGAQVRRRLATEQLLRGALHGEGVLVAYQPIIDLSSRTVAGHEALVRLRNPAGSVVPPSEFIGVAEDTGLIVPLGAQVLKSACGLLAERRRFFGASGSMSVNVSPHQLLDPTSLCVELTESALIDSGPAAQQAVERLKGLGVRLALDDFGTGWSSLAYLRRFPLDVIKIDRSFVAGIGTTDDDAVQVVKAVIGLGHALNLTIVAEGVENEIQEQMLIECGCDQAQGYLYGKPVVHLPDTAEAGDRVAV